MKQNPTRLFFILAVVLFAVAACAEDVEIGFPKDYRRWKPVVADNPKTPDALRAMGRYALVERKNWKCVLLECAAPAKAGNVSIHRKLALTAAQEQMKLKGVRVELYTRDIRMLVVRFVDDTGQTFQNRYEIPDSTDVQTVFCELPHERIPGFPPDSIWGGAKDKAIHYPIREISLLIDGSMSPDFRIQSIFKTVPVTLTLYLGHVTLVYE